MTKSKSTNAKTTTKANKTKKTSAASPNTKKRSSPLEFVMSEWPAADDEFILKRRSEGMAFKDIANELETYAWAVRKRHTYLIAAEKYQLKQAKRLQAQSVQSS